MRNIIGDVIMAVGFVAILIVGIVFMLVIAADAAVENVSSLFDKGKGGM